MPIRATPALECAVVAVVLPEEGKRSASMPHLSPFFAAVYTPRRSDGETMPPGEGSLEVSSYLAPTYDQVDDRLLEQLRAANPDNAVLLDAPHGYAGHRQEAATAEGAFGSAGGSPPDYQSARLHFNRMVLERTITLRQQPAVYIVRQTFRLPQRRPHRRLALLAALPAVPAGPGSEGGVWGHEATETVTVDDRLALLRSLEVQTSPVFGLYRDRSNTIEDWMRERMIAQEPIRFGVGIDGTLHELWEVASPGHVADLIERFGERAVIIADGHNRFNAAVAWNRQGRPSVPQALSTVAAGAPESPAARPASQCMFALVAEQDPGMSLMPVHRVYGGVRDWSMERFQEAAAGLLRVDAVEARLESLLEAVAQARYEGSHAMGVYDYATHRCFVSTSVDIDPLGSRFPHAPTVWRQSDPVLCEHLIFETVLAGRMNGGQRPACRRVADLRALQRLGQHPSSERVQGTTPQVAFVLMPLPLGDVFEIALSGHLLPPNSTHFAPKFASGLIMLPLSSRWSTA